MRKNALLCGLWCDLPGVPNNALVAFQPPVVILQVSPDAFIYWAESNLEKGRRDSFNTHHVQSILHVGAALSFIRDEDLQCLNLNHLSLTGLVGFCLSQKLLLEGSFLFGHCCMARGILVLQPGVNTILLAVGWKCRVLTTGPLGKSLERTFFFLIELPLLFPPAYLSQMLS